MTCPEHLGRSRLAGCEGRSPAGARGSPLRGAVRGSGRRCSGQFLGKWSYSLLEVPPYRGPSGRQHCCVSRAFCRRCVEALAQSEAGRGLAGVRATDPVRILAFLCPQRVTMYEPRDPTDPTASQSFPTHISKTVPPTVHLGPPTYTVDRTVFEMWVGSL